MYRILTVSDRKNNTSTKTHIKYIWYYYCFLAVLKPSTISITIFADTNDRLRWQILRFHGNIQLQIL